MGKKKGSKTVKKTKEKKEKKAGKPRYKLYEAKGSELAKKGKFCPKCGDGVYLAVHKDRLTCGKCNYMEKVKK